MIIGVDASRANIKQRTGTEWYSFFIIQELKRADKNNTYLLYSKTPLQGDLAVLPRNFSNRILKWPLKYLWTQFRLTWEMLWRAPEVLFVPAHTLPVLGFARNVVTIHDVGFRAYPELYSWKDILYHRFSVWYAAHYAAKIICPSEFTKHELSKYYDVAPKKIAVVPHGIQRADPAQARQPQKYFLYVGRIEEKKNILGMIAAFEKFSALHPGYRLILAGRPGHGAGSVRQYVAAHKLASSVEMPGYVTDDRRAELYAGATAFLFPTFYEGFGLPILEAQAAGVPVITSRYGACREVAGESAILVDPHDVDDLAAALGRMVSVPELVQDLTKKGFLNVQYFSWKRAAEETLKVLESA